MAIPILCPCSYHILGVYVEFLQGLTDALGYEALVTKCEDVCGCVSEKCYEGGETVGPISPPVVLAIISRGAELIATDTSDSSEQQEEETLWSPDPTLGNFSCFDSPNKKLALFLVEEGVTPSTLEAIRTAGYPEDSIIRFRQGAIAMKSDRIAKKLREFEIRLRRSPWEYQDPAHFVDLGYESLSKRTYVWEDGFGLVEMRMTIRTRELFEKGSRVGDNFVFPHFVAVRPSEESNQSAFESSLGEIRTSALASLFSHDMESFAVTRFGEESTKIDCKEDLAVSTDKEKAFRVVVPVKSLEKSETLSYGIIWSKRDLFPALKELSVLRLQNDVEKVTTAVRFMRPLSGESWAFHWGPRLYRYGPYSNDLGYIDSDGVCTTEQFHYFEYAWEINQVPRGSAFVAKWQLDREYHKRNS